MLPSLLLSAFLFTSMPVPAGAVAGPVTVPAPAPTAALPTPQFRRYGTAEGLPSSSVYTVVQAPDGAMWFGTKGGIARYDGVGFKVLRHVVGDAQSLFNNGISALMFDQGGTLWAGGLEAGLNRYDERTNTFQHWTHEPNDPASLRSDKVWSIAQTPDGVLWVGTAQGLERMRPDGRGFDHVDINSAVTGLVGTVGALFVDGQGQLWIGGENAIYRRDTAGEIHQIMPETPEQPLDAWRIEGEGDQVRVASSHGLFLIGHDDVARQLGVGELPETNILSSIRDQAGRMWVGTQHGLYLQDGAGRGIQAVTDQPLLYGNLPGTWVWQIQPDSEGGLWIALFDGGVGYLAPGWNSVSRFTHVPATSAACATRWLPRLREAATTPSGWASAAAAWIASSPPPVRWSTCCRVCAATWWA